MTFGHQQMSLVKAIVDLAEVAAKEPRDLPKKLLKLLICVIALLLSETKLKLPMAC